MKIRLAKKICSIHGDKKSHWCKDYGKFVPISSLDQRIIKARRIWWKVLRKNNKFDNNSITFCLGDKFNK